MVDWVTYSLAAVAEVFPSLTTYPYSRLFDLTYLAVMSGFKKALPNIDVRFRATYECYENVTNTNLREAVASNQPGVTMQGLTLAYFAEMIDNHATIAHQLPLHGTGRS